LFPRKLVSAYIASDDLEGRNTPAAGLAKAAQFIASNLSKRGVEPAGDTGWAGISRHRKIRHLPSDTADKIDYASLIKLLKTNVVFIATLADLKTLPLRDKPEIAGQRALLPKIRIDP
jgi:hypothetical protein